MKLRQEFVGEVADKIRRFDGEALPNIAPHLLIEPEEGLDYVEEVMCIFSVSAHGYVHAYADLNDPEENLDLYGRDISWEEIDVMSIDTDKRNTRLRTLDGEPFDKIAWLVKKSDEIVNKARALGVDIPPWFYELDENQTTLEQWSVLDDVGRRRSRGNRGEVR